MKSVASIVWLHMQRASGFNVPSISLPSKLPSDCHHTGLLIAFTPATELSLHWSSDCQFTSLLIANENRASNCQTHRLSDWLYTLQLSSNTPTIWVIMHWSSDCLCSDHLMVKALSIWLLPSRPSGCQITGFPVAFTDTPATWLVIHRWSEYQILTFWLPLQWSCDYQCTDKLTAKAHTL